MPSSNHNTSATDMHNVSDENTQHNVSIESVSSTAAANFWRERQLANYFLTVGSQLGQGAFGTVYGGQLPVHGENSFHCAIKRPNAVESEWQQEKVAHQRATADRSTRESRVVRFVAETEGGDMILSICATTLLAQLKTIQAIRLQSSELFDRILVDIFEAMVLALGTLQEACLIHRDLKPANIFFRKDYWCVGDLGLAVSPEQLSRIIEQGTVQGTPLYLAPEMILNNPEGLVDPYAIDIYSFGMMLCELLGYSLIPDGVTDVPAMLFCVAQDAETTRRNAAASQRELICSVSCDVINQCTTVQNCLELVAESMCEVLPEMRPKRDVLLYACEKMKSLISAQYGEGDAALKEFYAHMVAAATQSLDVSRDSLSAMEEEFVYKKTSQVSPVKTPQISPIKHESVPMSPEGMSNQFYQGERAFFSAPANSHPASDSPPPFRFF